MNSAPAGPVDVSAPVARTELIRPLLHYATRNRLDARQVLLALEHLLGPGETAPDPAALVAELRRLGDPGLTAIARDLEAARRADALELFRLRQSRYPISDALR